MFLAVLPLFLSGCQNARQLETASVIENISVERQDGTLYYTFYILTDGETPNAVAVPAPSLKEARSLAEKQYIPNLSLSKLELLLIHRDVAGDILKSDIEYISTQAAFSPVAYVAVCDTKALEKIKEDTAVQAMIENQLILCKKNNPAVNINYLSVFNCYTRRCTDGFQLPYLTADTDLKVSSVKIEK